MNYFVANGFISHKSWRGTGQNRMKESEINFRSSTCHIVIYRMFDTTTMLSGALGGPSGKRGRRCHPSLYLIFSNHFLILSFSMLLSMTALSRFCFLHIHVSTHHSVEFRGCRTKVETRCKRATSLFSITCIYTYLLSQHNT